MIKKGNIKGQAALILILLAAAALIFFAITLNWGRVAQSKTLLTVAADQAAALLASDAASYGEMQKQTYLKDENQYTALSGTFFAIIAVVIAIVVAVLSWGVGGVVAYSLTSAVLATIGAVAAVATLVLQVVVISPGITELWNKQQKNQPIQQQFYEEGISTALQSAVTDQVNITDYLDSNANGLLGSSASNMSNDIVGRFAFFYSDRLKMLNKPINPQLIYFFQQLGLFVNGGETCAQNVLYNNLNPNILLSATCTALNPDITAECNSTPASPDCLTVIPNGFQLSDKCVDSVLGTPTYNPYCDPCCQPMQEANPNYVPATFNPLESSSTINIRPASCPQVDPLPDGECQINNPYSIPLGANDSLYPLLYDASYQEYKNGTSFLDKWGRDQQATLPPPSPMEPPFILPLTLQGNFPNGIYPFFWLMDYYSPEVDNVVVTGLISTPVEMQYQWCTASVTPLYTQPVGFSDVPQLTMPYACVGQDCCINFIDTSLTAPIGGVPASTAGSSVNLDVFESPNADAAGTNTPNPATNPIFGDNSQPWVSGDTQFCSVTWPYNGSSMVAPDGMCEWNSTDPAVPPPPAAPPGASNSTMDALDDTMHTLSDFAIFSNSFFNADVGTLNSTMTSWYPQVAAWIAPACNGSLYPPLAEFAVNPTCTDGQDGRLLGAKINLDKWADLPGQTGTLTQWLLNTYTSANTWCLPTTDAAYPNFSGSNEDKIIKDAITPPGAWGTLSSVIACMNYNATTAPAVYNACSADLAANNNPSAGCTLGCCTTPPTPPGGPPGATSPVSTGQACDPLILGRSLYTPLPNHPFKPSDGDPPHVCDTSCVPMGFPPAAAPTPSETCTPGVTPNITVIDTIPGQGEDVTFTYTDTTTYYTSSYQYGCTITVTHPPNCSSCSAANQTCGACSGSPASCTCSTSTLCSTGWLTATCGSTYPTPPAPPISGFKSFDCDATQVGSFANWAQDNAILAGDEASKFALRGQFLTDMQTRAQNMQSLIDQGDVALQFFLQPCSGPNCSTGGPAAQLMYSLDLGSPTGSLPNSVIYGWRDSIQSGGSGGCFSGSTRVGCEHVVKVTAYAPGRAGIYSTDNPPPNGIVWSQLPFIKTSTGWFTRSYTLTDRDGPVYVDVKRWDQDHTNPVSFPNGHSLWQFFYHKPSTSPIVSSSDPFTACTSSTYGLMPAGIGFGLELQTAQGLGYYSNLNTLSSVDVQSLGDAFMLNDEGTGPNAGKVDPMAATNSAAYLGCLGAVNQLLDSAPESYAYAEYEGSWNAQNYPSPLEDRDYSIRFWGGKHLQDDLNYEE